MNDCPEHGPYSGAVCPRCAASAYPVARANALIRAAQRCPDLTDQERDDLTLTALRQAKEQER